jgi:hypothetical protein
VIVNRVYLLYSGENLLDIEILTRMQDIENSMMFDERYKKFCVLEDDECAPPSSPVSLLLTGASTQEDVE